MTSAARCILLSALVSLCVIAASAGADAQSPAADEAAAGDADEYRRTIASALDEFRLGHFADARALFERAHQLQPSARTLRGMGFADFESQHYALALSEIEAALADPRKPLDTDQRREAEELRARLQGLVGALSVRVTPSGATLFVNEVDMPNPDLRLDPGEYVVRATADGHASGEVRVRIEAGQPSSVEIALVPIERAPVSQGLSGQRVGALVAGGVGVAAVIVGSIFGVRSIVKHEESDDFCSDAGACRDARGVEAMDQARTAGDISTVAWAIGGLGLVGAGVLWFTAPEQSAAPAEHTRLGLGLGAVQLETRW